MYISVCSHDFMPSLQLFSYEWMDDLDGFERELLLMLA